MARLERAISASRTQRSTKLSHIPKAKALLGQGQGVGKDFSIVLRANAFGAVTMVRSVLRTVCTSFSQPPFGQSHEVGTTFSFP